MKSGIAKRIVIALCACMLGAVLASCTAPASSTVETPEQANRAYMSQLNEMMVSLDESLDQFVDATSRGDVVNMRTQADNAFKVIEEFEAIEAPEDMVDIREMYLLGTSKLRDALNSYINLYTEAAAAGDSYDWSKQDKRIADIQTQYDEGVKALKDADAEVAAKASGETTSSSSSSKSA